MPRRPVVVREAETRPLRRSEILHNIYTAVDAIGHTVNTTPTVASKDNNGGIAYDYRVAHRVAARAEDRKKRAVAEAVKAGVIFDHTKTPLEPGTTSHPVFLGDQVFITCTVSGISNKTDWEAVVNDLINSGKITLKDVDPLITAHTGPKAERGAHTFSSSLIIP